MLDKHIHSQFPAKGHDEQNNQQYSSIQYQVLYEHYKIRNAYHKIEAILWVFSWEYVEDIVGEYDI